MPQPSYVGTRWHKCDLHLHTPASLCFRDRDTVTAAQWVARCLEQGLSCVAVTDHNTGAWIDQIKAAAADTELTIFPGVEITCSDAKVHLLILFDIDKGTTEVNDFLIRAGIDRDKFGKQDAHSAKSILQVADLAESAGAICMPAHVDEFNGLCEVGNQPRMEFLREAPVLGVQVVHSAFLVDQRRYTSAFREELSSKLATYYGREIQSDRIQTWRQAALQSKETGKAILTFSDNPHAAGDSRHGLWGIGSRYTWIKMEAQPNLESLVQALLVPKYRIRNDFECPAPHLPYHMPDTWLKKITITGTRITGTEPLELAFSPQMNTIVGGRGSGKSSILRFLRGLFPQCQEELAHLEGIKRDFTEFFKPVRNGIGVLDNGSSLVLDIHRNGADYQLTYQRTQNREDRSLSKWNPLSEQYEAVEDTQAIRRIELDMFAQKQVFDIATETNSLRDRIDHSNEAIQTKLVALGQRKNEYLEQGAHLRSLQAQIARKEEVASKILDAEQRIQAFSESGTAELLQQNERFGEEQRLMDLFVQQWQQEVDKWKGYVGSLQIPTLDSSLFAAAFQAEIKALDDLTQRTMIEFVKGMTPSLGLLTSTQQKVLQGITAGTWKQARQAAQTALAAAQTQLEAQGIPVMAMQEELDKKGQWQAELAKIETIEQSLTAQQDRLAQLRQAYISDREQLSSLRKAAVQATFSEENVRIKVKPCRDFEHFEQAFREILGTQKLTDDVDALLDRIQQSRPDKFNDLLLDSLEKIRAGQEGSGDFGARFRNKLNDLSGESWDQMALLHPEDDIVVEYKPNQASGFQPISTASPGQKTAAILTLILSQGEVPLILDQPEDDLDNNLIYQLVVEQLRQSKECRQIIVVTHNANIPVNGDSEHIIVMNGQTREVSPMVMGPLEESAVKRAICDIMEGGTEAFEMRSKRYAGLGNA
ncbi:MAG: TrlF family AAA-like ATPase [Bacteroidota bacterium]